MFSRPRPKTQEFKLNLPLNVTLDADRGVELSWVYDKTHIIMKVWLMLPFVAFDDSFEGMVELIAEER